MAKSALEYLCYLRYLLLLDIIVREGVIILKLPAGEDEALLVRRDSLTVLDLNGRGRWDHKKRMR